MHEHITSDLRVLIEVAIATGHGRAVNEDGVVLDPATGSCAVIDGGGARGELATALIQREYADLLAGALGVEQLPPEQALPWALVRLSALLQQANRSDPRMAGSGAAVTALLVHDDHAHIAHCGDARAYLLRAGVLAQITVDDTLVAELVAQGEIEPEQAADHPFANVVTQVLGFSDEIEVHRYEQALEIGDVLLLCTDGLWRAVPDGELATLCAQADGELHGALVDRAIRNGTDNVAVVVVRVEANAASG
jgi:serine/threonine protein phosphatase PrpC